MEARRILLVEDEEDILFLLDYHLKKAGFRTDLVTDGEAALKAVEDRLPDLMVLDLMLPGMDGIEVCRILRQNKKTEQLPIIMLTAKGAEADRILGLELGADDYVVKPFSPKEFVLRVKAVLRRAADQKEHTEVVGSGDLKIDVGSHTVWLGAEEISLTSTEFKLLLTLVRQKNRVLSRDRLLDLVWDYHFEGYARTVDTHVHRLRQKLGGHGEAIETVWGVGYRYKA